MGQKMWGCRYVLAIAAALVVFGPLEADESSSNDSAKVVSDFQGHSPALAERRIEMTLNMPLRAPLEFIETPLNQITEVLAEDYDIPILFDTSALDAVACSPEVETSIRVGNVSLRSALDLMLREASGGELTYIIEDEVLLITTQEEEDRRPEVRVYRVDDLSVAKPWPYPGATAHADFNSLIDLIVACVEHDSWMENGTGEGEIRPHGDGLIVITQTRRVHDQVNQLLADMRRNLADIDADEAARDPAEANRPITRGLRIAEDVVAEPSETKAAITKMLVQSVDWETDEADLDESNVFLRFEGNRIFVRHRPQVVKEVEEAAQGMGIIAPLHSTLASGAFGGEDKEKSKPKGSGGGGF